MTQATIAAGSPRAEAWRRWRRPDLSAFLADPVSVAALNATLILAFSSIFLARSWVAGLWMAPPHGARSAVDFAAFWASAKATLSGHAAQAYDWRNLQPILERAGGGPVSGKLPVYYPPPFLLLTAPLGVFSYTTAFALWVAAGVAAFAATVRLASRRPAVMIVGLAGMGVFASALVGQNGVYTAALLGAGLALADRRPLAAGVLLGLLCCKPQLALLVPVALAAGGRWRTLAMAAATAVGLAVMAGVVLGWDVYPAFLAAGAHARQSFAGAGWLPWAKVQTVYGDLRLARVDVRLAVAGGALAALAAAAVVAWLWREGARLPLRVAAVAA
ncbi:MAG: DUF2029 domain-containing protein, partial [Caulobacteraceae bacterium]|nr:DUF2029 domain-containing protein [Caulobacter sp.]